MKKIFTIAVLVSFVWGLTAQTTSYKMRVVKTDGTKVLYATDNMKYVDYISVTEEIATKKSIVIAGDNIEFDGPFAVVEKPKVGPWKDGKLWYPRELTNDPNKLHGVVVFCAGGGESSESQPAIPKRLASMGFVVYSMSSNGEGSDASRVFDWFEQKNNDPNDADGMYQKLCVDRVGITGHSAGGLMAEACTRNDKRVCCLMMCNSGDFGFSGATTITVPTGFLTGTDDMACGNSKGDYGNSANKAPMWLGIKYGEGHGYGPWGGNYCVAAWMRWHIAGETKWEKEFLQPGGMFNNANGWDTQTKNW